MKKFFTILLLCILVSTTAAQRRVSLSRSPEKFYLGASVGPSFPLNDFAEKDVNQISGYARTGYRLELYGGINILGIFGFGITGFLNINGTDPEKLRNKLNAEYPGSNWQIDSKNWTLYGGLGGVNFHYPINDRTSFHVKLMGGYLRAESPEFRFTSGISEYKIESKTASSLSYMTMLGFNYYLDQNVSLTLDFEFLGSKPNFDYVRTSANINGNVTESSTSFSRNMSAFNIALGFKYSFR